MSFGLGRRQVEDWEVFPAELIRETDKANLFEIEGEEVWVPKSLSVWQDEDGEVWIQDWKAKEMGL